VFEHCGQENHTKLRHYDRQQNLAHLHSAELASQTVSLNIVPTINCPDRR
jgi:hypothetical protein